MAPSKTHALALAGLTTLLFTLVGCGSDDEPLVADDLVGRSFVASEVVGHSAVDGTDITITFDGDLILVNAGCNSMRGSYSVEAGSLMVGAMASTMMMCEDALMEQETWVSVLLSSGPAIELDDETMTLTSGSTSMTLGEVG